MRIWLVEDDAGVLDVLREMLEFDGHEVRCFSDPRDALRTYEDGCCDALVTDLVMPGMYGAEMIRALEKRLGHAVVHVYATADPWCRERIEKGATVLQKPFAPEELETALTRVTGATVRSTMKP